MIHWNGLKLGDLEIGATLGDGSFSRVYKASNASGHCALKVAGTGFGDGSGATGFFQSKALEQITSGFAEIQPDPITLLKAQYAYLNELQDHASVVRVFELHETSEYSYIRMELLEGKNLRQHMLDGSKELLNLMVPFLAELNKLDLSTKYRGHGDLKPENLFVSNGKIRILDPGYHGSIRTKEGLMTHATVTTPVYYPSLNNDDLFALGLILWELACGEQLLDSRAAEKTVGPKLDERLLQFERVGNHFHSKLRRARPPQSIVPMSEALAAVLTKAVRLSFDTAGVPELADGFKSIAQLHDALADALK